MTLFLFGTICVHSQKILVKSPTQNRALDVVAFARDVNAPKNCILWTHLSPFMRHMKQRSDSTFYKIKKKSQNISNICQYICQIMEWKTNESGVDFRRQQTIFPSTQRPDLFWGPSSLLCKSIKGPSPR
jgi:hypothetical protein